MAGKRFFWLKLQEDFFQEKAMKKLRRMEHGEVLTIIYLKMQLASLRNGGAIAFEGLGGTFAEELSLQIDEPEEDVAITVDFLSRYGLMEQVNGGDLYILPKAIENTGSEGDSAARMRSLRDRKASQCDGEVSQSDDASQCDAREREEKKKSREDSEREREKDPAASPPPLARDSRNLIFLDDKQYRGLVADLGEQEVKRCIEYLSEYCSTHGKSYKDWPTMIRKASREKWGIPKAKLTTTGDANFQPTPERIQKNNDWLDAFLAEQRKNGRGDVDGQ